MATNRIQFFKTPEASSALSWLIEESGLSEARLKELMALGAVYLEDERVFKDQPLTPGQTLRLHREPKRYQGALIDWKPQIFIEAPDFLVVHKLSGVPTHATLDNWTENMLFQLSKALGQKLYPAHRLDTDTSGVCLLARRPEFQAIFHRILKSRDTEKNYDALTLRAPPLGLHQHFIKKQKRPPHSMFDQNAVGLKPCELEVTGVEKRESAFKVQIRLLTGRTHQIRAQLAHLGSPLLGDHLYGGAGDASSPFFLHARELSFTHQGRRYEAHCEANW